MTPKTPAVWPSTCYVRPIKAETGGRRASTHLAQLKDPQGVACRGYVKHFPPTAHRALFNEWFGYTVMSVLGVPQPPSAIMEAPIPGTKTVRWAFVSCQPRPKFEGTPKELYYSGAEADCPSLLKRLQECHSMPALIAADQLLIHSDRNMGNLVFTSKRAFVAIDHSDILGGPVWHMGSLQRPTEWALSLPIEQWTNIDDLKPGFKSALFAAAQLAQEAFYDCQPELREALSTGTSIDCATALDSLWWRNANLARWFQDRLKLLA